APGAGADHAPASIRAKILANYEELGKESAGTPAFKERVDLITKPDGNYTNSIRLEPIYAAIDHWEMTGEKPTRAQLDDWFGKLDAGDGKVLAEDGRFRRWFHEQLGLPAADHDALQGKLPPEAKQAAPTPPGDEGKTAPQNADNPAQAGAGTKASKQQSGVPELQGQDPSVADKQAVDELNAKRPNPGLAGTPEPQVGAPSISEQLSNNVNATLVAQDMSGQVTVQPGTHALVGSRNYADCV